MIRGINHVGISVANLDQSIRFYREMLGMEVVLQKTFHGPRYEAILGLDGARGKLAVVRHGDIVIELFEFENPSPKRSEPQRPVCDHGITHFCIEVTEVQRVYERLNAAGVCFHCPPLTFKDEKATYGRDPDGNVFELLELIPRVGQGS